MKRLEKFSLELEPKKTRLVEFGRFALRMAKEQGKRLETIHFLGFTHFCTRNRKGNFMVRRRIEKSRFRRSVQNIQTLMREIRHYSLREQVKKINQVLRGHYAYHGVGGNFKSLFKIHRFAERYWHKMLCSRSQKSYITWERFQSLKQVFPLQRPKLSVPYMRMKALCAVNQILKSVMREICMLRSVGVGALSCCPFYPALGVKFPRSPHLSFQWTANFIYE